MKKNSNQQENSLRKVFEAVPDRYVLIAADPPEFTIIEASNAYLEMAGTERSAVVGRGVFEAFPEHPSDPDAVDQPRLREALEGVLDDGHPHSVGTYRYDVADADMPHRYAERYWSLRLAPVFGDDDQVDSILIRVEEVTDFVLRERYCAHADTDSKVEGDGPRRVLIVEPDEKLRTFLAEAFSTQWAVDAVASAETAKESIEHNPPAAVLAAMDLPDIAAVEFIEQMNQTGSFPLIMRLEGTDRQMYREAFEAGADDVMGGPASPREYISRVRSQISENDVRDAIEERSRGQLHQLLTDAPMAISLVEGPDKVYTLSNPANNDMIDGREIVGLPMREVFPEPDFAQYLDLVDEVYESGKPHFASEVGVRVGAQPGAEVPLNYLTFAILPYRDLRGGIQGVAILGYEVTEQVQARQALERENQRKDEFLAMLGHELRNPLAPIVHANQVLQMLGDQLPPQRVQWATRTIARQADQLTRLVDDLLDVSRISQGRINLRRTEVDLDELVSGAVETIQATVDERDQHLEVCLPGMPVELAVDRERMIQAISNLLDNACKYTPPGGHIWLEARVRDQADAKSLELEVRDDGKGIEADLLPDIFDLFTQGDVTIDRSEGGLGLGLGLVKRICEMHGGTVEAYSEGRNRGSRFVLELPVVTSVEAPSSPEVEAESSLAVHRVLVVDDNADLAKSLSLLLQARGAQVHTAADGETALQMADSYRPDTVLLDIGLPGMDGYEVARKLRETEHCRDTRLIALTGYGLADDVQKAMQAGFDRHLTKPAQMSDLIKALTD